MKSPLRILHLEDNEDDAELIHSALAEEGIDCETVRVESRSGFIAALEQGHWDLILSDNTLPSYDGLSALADAREKCPDVPFVFVSGTLGEEVAIEALKLGATDYVLKQRLSRLKPALKRALREVEERTQRKELEDQFRQSQKMEAVGRLAGGIAHDFNNMLTVINGYSEMLLQNLSPEDPRRSHVEQILHAGERAASLTSQLLSFSRKQVLDLKVLDLNAVAANLDRMLQRLIGEDIDLVTLLKPGLGRVKADQGQVEQILMNLAVNARDAMPQGGTLTIETANVELDEAYARQHVAVLPGPYVMLALSDTGCGMDEETQSRIFEPFFTTKEQGKGTGLGLSTVYGIVKQGGGYIFVYSEVGQGTTFKIFLPRVEADVTPAEPEVARTTALSGTENILLVEDEPEVRHLVREILGKSGYVVLEADDSDTAVQFCGEYPGKIHLMVTDVVMPGMGGRELAERVKPSRPDMTVLFVSGYTDDAVIRHGIHGTGVAFLQKPFTSDALLRKVRDVLDANHGRGRHGDDSDRG
jgi:two-component system, cell cycle sensor histidine kinase and response regulator CckA